MVEIIIENYDILFISIFPYAWILKKQKITFPLNNVLKYNYFKISLWKL